MKEVQLTQGYVALVDDEDFERVSKFSWYAQVQRFKDKRVRNVYAQKKEKLLSGARTTKSMHAFIVNNPDLTAEVDHEDHNGLNNQKHNLRKATKADNQHNTRKRINNTSGYKGAYWNKKDKVWRAMIGINSKLTHLGSYATSEQAARAYDEAALRLFGEFANTNF
jgi:hypothetical protein